jgi:valyl-tRNA synthetase
MNLTEDDEELLKTPSECELAVEDKWILSAFNKLCKTVNDNVDNYEIGIALGEIYSFTWNTFCDWYIEMAKSRTFEGSTPAALTAKRVLVYVLSGILKLLHPYMPFITEEIFSALPHTEESIMIASYPTYDPTVSYDKEEVEVERIISCITAIRARRAEMNIAPSKKAKLFVVTKYEDTFSAAGKILEKLASVSELHIVDKYESDDAVSIATDSGNLYIPLAEVVDFEKEKARLTAEYEKNEGEISRLEKKLSNEGFVAKAPEAVVNAERAKLQKYIETRAALTEALAKLK